MKSDTFRAGLLFPPGFSGFPLDASNLSGLLSMPQADIRTLRVLVVEDDQPTRFCLALALQSQVEQVLQACNGHDGLERYREFEPDVVITDIRMPVLDGLEMVRAIREAGGEPFIIMASGFSDEESYMGAIEVGVNLFVKKPCAIGDILKGLDRAAIRRSARRRDVVRRALADGLLANVPNCHLLTDGCRVLHFNDPKNILPAPAGSGQDLGAYLREHFSLCARPGTVHSSMPQGIASWLERHAGQEFVLAAMNGHGSGNARRFLLRVDAITLDPDAAVADRGNSLLTFTDISQIETERERFYQLAGRDFLTGVANRHAFETELAREAGRARRHGTELCLVMLDIDDFKAVNDRHGHQAGDQVLVRLAKTVGEGVRISDVVCRYGGEEFMVIMPQTSLEGALAWSRKLCRTIAKQDFAINRQVTVSVGLGLFNPEECLETLIHRVDIALYQAKNGGKNQVVVAGPAAFYCAGA